MTITKPVTSKVHGPVLFPVLGLENRPPSGPSTPVPPSNSALPTISGNTWAGQVMTCSTGTWAGSRPITYAYQWKADGTPISGATAATYTVAAVAGTAITCEVTATNSAGTEFAVSPAVTVTVAPPTQVSAPAVSGSPLVGGTLTSTSGQFSNADSFTYQWMADGAPISGATSSSYVVAQPVDTVVYCRVGAVNAGGTTYGASNSFHVRDEDSLPVFGSQNSGVGGTWGAGATRGFASPSTITETINTSLIWAHFGFGEGTGNVNPGLPWKGMIYADNGGAPGALIAVSDEVLTLAGGRWQSAPLEVELAAGTYWIAISAAGGTLNAATVAQGGVTGGMHFANGSFSLTTPPANWPEVTEARNNTLAAFVTYVVGEPVEVAPANTVAPVVSGNDEIGSTLSCTTGTWTGTAPITYGYQWRANGTNISGATAATFDTTGRTDGEVITCMVTATNVAGSASEVSNGITLIEEPAAEAPVNTVAPVVTGGTDVGSVLSSTTGTWTGTAPISYTYQWRANGTPISGATSATFNTTGRSAGEAITCLVTATNSVGSASQASNAVTLTEAPAPGGLAWDTGYRATVTSAKVATWSDPGTTMKHVRGSVLTGKVYFEVEQSPGAHYSARIGVARRVDTDPGTGSPLGQYFNQQSYGTMSSGNVRAYLNGSLVAQFAANTSTDPARRHAIAYDADTGEIWGRQVWSGGASAWVGGGDPATGTSPGVLEGPSPAKIYACAEASGGTVTIIDPEDHYGTAPAGFTAI